MFRPGSLPLAGIPLPRLIPWLNVLLVALLAWSLAQLSWRLLPQDEAALAVPVIAGDTAAPVRSAPVSLEQVAALHLFGDADEPRAPETAAPITAPETRLNLKLKGVAALDSQQQALAIIAEGRGEEKAYRVGQTLPGGAVLHEIRADRVILQRGGRFETLTLPKERMADGGAGLPPAASPAGNNRVQSARPSASAQRLQAVRKRLLQNPQEALQLINAQPVMEGGQLKGYRLHPGRDRRLFSSVGLRPGDIVTSVNGIPLSDPAQMGQLFNQLSTAGRLDVTVQRGGRLNSLSLELE
jgi:general secretion pathway protein C